MDPSEKASYGGSKQAVYPSGQPLIAGRWSSNRSLCVPGCSLSLDQPAKKMHRKQKRYFGCANTCTSPQLFLASILRHQAETASTRSYRCFSWRHTCRTAALPQIWAPQSACIKAALLLTSTANTVCDVLACVQETKNGATEGAAKLRSQRLHA